VSDTGDDVAVSRTVATLVARAWPIDGAVVLHGDVPLFGGDAAYDSLVRRALAP
jgi:hypothetical protein